ncbi:MAG: type II and III secretion system protein family protein, partial [Planctomycetota bacterium]
YGAVTVAPSSGTPLISELAIGPESVSNTFSSAVTLLAGVPRANLEVFLQALAENQYLRLLANPTLVALSGEDASFLAGGEYPIPVVQNSGGGGTSISVEYQEYGIRLNFRPIVLGDGSIRLYMAPEVSELTNVGAVTIEGFSIPALVTRKMHTTLELKSGQTFAMAGLIKNKSEATNSRVPGLGDLPILGPLFRSVRYQTNETELVVLVTASLVEPMSLAKTPPLPGFLHEVPDDWELYLDGRIESQEPAKIHPDDAAWLKQNGLDHLLGPGAWDSYFRAPPSSQADMSMNSDAEGVDTHSIQGGVNPLDPVGLGSTDSAEAEDTI